MTQTDPTSGVGIGVLKPKVAERTDFSFAPPAVVGQIKKMRPEFAGYNDLALAQKLLKDQKFADDIVKQIISQGADDIGRERYKNDPKVFEADFNKIRTGIQSQVAQSFTKGTDVKQSIIKSVANINNNLDYRPGSKINMGTVVDKEGIQYVDIGFVSAKEESGGKYDTISTGKGDPGGVSYGKFQLSSNAGTLEKFIADSTFKDEFGSVKPATEEFNTTWKKLATNKNFQREQDNFITNNNFRPIEFLYAQNGIDTSNVAIREAIFSASVQHGAQGNKKILEDALIMVGDDRNPEKLVEALYMSRKNYVNSLTSLDDKMKKSIGARYDRELSTVRGLLGERDTDILPPYKMRQVINNAPEKFENFYDQIKKKSTVPTGRTGDEILANIARNNRDFDGTIKEEYMSSFENELFKSHNIPISSEQDPELYANAFAIWDAYGAEGLTKFVNLIQFRPRMESVREDAWDKRYSEARSWFGTPQLNGVTPQKYVNTFMGSLVLDPPTKNPITEYDIPKDFNSFTKFGYKPNQLTKKVDRLSDDVFVSNIIDSVYATTTERNSKTQNLIKSGQLSLKQIKEDTKNGFGVGYDRLRDDIVYMSRNGELDFNLQDMGGAIMGNGKYVIDPDLGQSYIVDDYKNAPASIRLALDTIRLSKEGEDLIVRGVQKYPGESRSMMYVPKRAEALGERNTLLGNVFRAVTADKQEAIYDDNGNVIGSRTVADNEGFWGLYNGIVAIPWKIAELTTSLIIEPALKAGAYGARKLGYETTAQELERIDDLADNLDVLNYDTNGFGEGLQVSDITGGVVELVGLFAAAKATGGFSLGALSRSFNMFNNINKGVRLGTQVAPAMQNVGKFERFNRILGKNNTKLWVGFGGVDALGGENYSLLNSGLMGEDAERYYRNQSQSMRIGLDVMGGLAIGELFDWSLAAVATTGRRAFRRGPLREGEGFTKELFSRTQIGEMSRDVSTALRDLEVGNLKDSFIKRTDDRLNNVIYREPKTLSDITVNFVEGTNVYMENIRQEVKASLRKTNDKASSSFSWGGRLTDADLEKQTDTIYNEAIDNMAKRVLSFFESGQGNIDDTLWLQFTNIAEEMASVSRIRPSVTDTGNPRVFTSKSDAISETMVRDTNTNIVVSNGRFVQQLEDGRYGVYELENYHWSKDLADSIRRKATQSIGDDRAIDLMSMATGLKKDVPEDMERLVNLVADYNGVRTYDDQFNEVVLIGKTPQEEGLFVFRRNDGTTTVGRLAEPRLVNSTVGENATQTIRINGDEIIDASVDTTVRALLPPARTNEEFASVWLDDSVNKIANNKSQRIEPKGVAAGKAGTPTGFSDNIASGLAKFAGSTLENIQASVSSIARKIGVDDIRLLTAKSSAKSRLVAPNSAGKIQEWKTKSNIKKDVLVRHVDADGLDAYWVSNKKTKLEPSTWVYDENSALIKNPDWDRTTENATFLRTGETGPVNVSYYKKLDDGNGFYQLTTPDDPDAVILNIQKPVSISEDDVVNARYLDDDFIVDNNIDGYYANIKGVAHFRPISSIEQAVLPESITQTFVTKASDSIVPEVSTAARLGAVVIGGMGGSLSTGLFEDDEVSTAGGMLGAVLGLLGGGRRGRQVVQNVKNITTPSKNSGLIKEIDNAVNHPLNNDNYIKATEIGYAGKASDTAEIKAFNDHTEEVKGKLIGDKFRDFFKTKYTESSFGFMGSIGSVTSTKLRNIFFRINDLAVGYRAKPVYLYDQKRGSGAFFTDNKDGIRLTEELMSQNDAVVSYAADNGIQLTREYAKELYNDFSAMMLESGGRLMDNASNVKVQDYYKNNPQVIELHQALKNDGRFVDMYNSKRDMLNTVKRDYLSAISRAIKDDIKLVDVGQVDQKIITDWAETIINPNSAPSSRISYATLQDQLKKQDSTLAMRVDRLKNTPDGRLGNIVKMADSYRTFQEFGDEYYTQLLDPQKIEAARQKFFFANSSRFAGEEEMEKAFKMSLVKRFNELNGSASVRTGKKYLFRYNQETDDIEEMLYNTLDEARGKLAQIMQDRNLPDDVAIRLRDNMTMDVFVKSDVDNKYRIDMNHPAFRDESGSSYFDNYETAHMEQMLDRYITGVATKQSNFLDRRRKFVLPFELQITDQDRWLYRYTQDVGPRIHLVQNGITDTISLKKNYIERIKKEMMGKVSSKVIDKYVNRIESIYQMQVGFIRSVMDTDDPKLRMKAMGDHVQKERAYSIFRNLFFGAAAPAISILDAFQAKVFSPSISSGPAVSEGYRLLRQDPQAFNNFVNVAEAFGIATRNLELIRPDTIGVDDAVAIGSGKIDKAYAMSQRFADFGSRFSMIGTGYKMLGLTYDPKNMGTVRLASDFYTVNAATSTINMYAALIEVNTLAKALREMGTDTQTVIHGKTYNRSDIINKFESLGIYKDKVDRFVANTERFENMISDMKLGKNMSKEQMDKFPSLYEDMNSVINTATDIYHAKNKMSRPEAWTTPIGKFLTQFSTYSWNYSAQLLNNRIYRPISNWMEKYNDTVEKKATPTMIMSAMATKNYAKLREWGFTDEAIRELPLDAWYSVFKALKSASYGSAVIAGRDLYFDAVNAATLTGFEESGIAVDEDEYFRRTRRNFLKEDGTPYWEFDNINDGWKAFTWAATWASKSGIAGKAGDIFFNPFMERGGIATVLGPGANFFNDISKGYGRVYGEDLTEKPAAIAEELYKNASRFVPLGNAYGLNRWYKMFTSNQTEQRGGVPQFEMEPALSPPTALVVEPMLRAD